MSGSEASKEVHPQGEGNREPEGFPAAHRVETFGGPIQVRWEEDAGVSMYGPLTYFIEFLKVSGVWERFVEECPLRYTSRNAPTKNEILGTILFSVLSGHRRYAHITAIRGDEVLPRLLGIEQFRSEDSVRRAFEKQDEEAMTLWMDRHTNDSYAALLEHDWILDLDATVKTLYGRQEEARVGYNPMKPGRPSHVYQAMLFSAAKLVVNVDVQAGNQTASQYAQPTLWGWLDAREKTDWPTLLRGDIAHGNEEMMAGAEARGLEYVFKLRQTKGVAKLIEKLARLGEKAGWQDAGQRWEGVESELQLQGWSRKRRVLVLRRRLREPRQAKTDARQPELPGLVIEHKGGDWYEHAVLVTNWDQPAMLAIAQVYRDRGDAENMFDELKSQWGWTGFSTADLKRSQLMARMVALIFNWWSIFTRMATGSKHGEAITTRPLFQHGVARRTRHANQTQLSISSQHGKAKKIAYLLSGISSWIQGVKASAEQLTERVHWPSIVKRIFQDFGRFPLVAPRIMALDAASNCRI
jgi:hypothetical protein